MFDINGAEFLILLLVVAVVVGPEKLPRYVRELRGWAMRLRDLMTDARSSVRDELGDTVDFATLDPRQYDPRHIVKDVLAEPARTPEPTSAGGRAARRRSARIRSGEAPPFDDDAT